MCLACSKETVRVTSSGERVFLGKLDGQTCPSLEGSREGQTGEGTEARTGVAACIAKTVRVCTDHGKNLCGERAGLDRTGWD